MPTRDAPTTMVALPGTLCAPSVFDPLVREFTGELAIEARGWLLAPGPWDVPSVAERLAGELAGRAEDPVLLCGHSTGGAIALTLAVAHPELVAGLMLIDTGAHMHGHGDVGAILTQIRRHWGEDLFAAVLDRSFLEPVSDDVRAGMLAWAQRVPQQAAYDVLDSQRTLDLTPILAGIEIPVSVVHGRYDRARDVSAAEELTAALPDAELSVLETGHTPMFEDPQAVASLVRRLRARANGQAPDPDSGPVPDSRSTSKPHDGPAERPAGDR